jgi:hypothetical protein
MKYFRTIFFIIGLVVYISNLYSQPNQNHKDNIKKLSSGCYPPSAISELDINNVRATIYNNGLLWASPDGYFDPGYEIPKGSGKHSIYKGGIIIGGVDNGGNLRLSSKINWWGEDFFPGPLASFGTGQGSTNESVCGMYDRIYKITKEDVQEFRDWYTADQKTRYEVFPEYVIPEILMEWPALGPEVDGFDYFLAPFVDYNGDNLYNPHDGDYPKYDLYNTSQSIATRASSQTQLYGDQTLWWVMNDKGNIQTHTPTGSPLGIEVRAQAFAFSSNNRLNDMSFYNYQIINKSTYTINDTYFGVMVEGMLGNPDNNYLACDVSRGLGYIFNGSRDDGSSPSEYGEHPPALGLDFLGGPYQDHDNSDFGESGTPAGCDESIMGINFNDGIVDNERLGMSYFMRVGQAPSWYPHTWFPDNASQVYNYIRGIWNDGYHLTYGNTGYEPDPGLPLVEEPVECRYMYPENSDPCYYNTNGIEVPPWDDPSNIINQVMDDEYANRNFIASSGPFTLEPGAINDVSFGLIWAQSYLGFNQSAIREMKKADDVAQTLFENNFQSMDGPNSPEIELIEMDQSILLHIWNSSESNNYVEGYKMIDPTIIPSDELVEDMEEAKESQNPTKIKEAQQAIDDYRSYVFQGYKVYQVIDKNTSVNDLTNPDLARLVFQCDIKDDISNILNYEWDSELKAYLPVEKVVGNNEGIIHSIVIDKDMFNEGSYGLINSKEYYYLAIAYAHNDYIHVDQLDPINTLYGQKLPYLESNKAARGAIRTYKAIPHPPSINNSGTITSAEFGDGIEITQHDGHGNSTNWIELKQETIDEIMQGPPWYADSLQFEIGKASIKVQIIDPLNILGGDYIVKMEPDSVNYIDNHFNRSDLTNLVYYGLILDTKWKLMKSSPGLNLYKDTIHSDGWIRQPNEQLFLNDGISITINQTDYPGARDSKFHELETTNLGYLGAKIEYEDEYVRWLEFVCDEDGNSPKNWIRSGERLSYWIRDYNDYRGLDNNEIFENVLGGAWAPYNLTSKFYNGPMYEQSQAYLQDYKIYRLSSVDIVFTNDTTKWTRSAVLDMSESSLFSIGGVEKHALRASPSINKLGEPDGTGTGMGWFPGYAIDVETGVRLNIVYSEASELANIEGQDYNCDDMMWNPTDDVYYEDLENVPLFGGKHYIYIFGHNEGYASNMLHNYDSCSQIYDLLTNGNNAEKMQLFMHTMWVSIPLIDKDYVFENPIDMPDEDITIKIRIANPYYKDVGVLESNAPNNNYPMYSFSTSEFAVEKGVVDVAKKSLEIINIVPNPYYGYSEYESNQVDNFVRFTNLPQKCIISIYQTNGTLIRKLEKDNENPYLEWDLKNQSNITIGGGIYLIHVNAPGIGERVLKWFGALRPVDLYGY